MSHTHTHTHLAHLSSGWDQNSELEIKYHMAETQFREPPLLPRRSAGSRGQDGSECWARILWPWDHVCVAVSTNALLAESNTEADRRFLKQEEFQVVYMDRNTMAQLFNVHMIPLYIFVLVTNYY